MANHTTDVPNVVELNVGGVLYSTSLATLTSNPDSYLGQMFAGNANKNLLRDNKGKYFLDRDGVLFRYVLDFVRNKKLVLPENFQEKERLKMEAEYFKLPEMVKLINRQENGREIATSNSTENSLPPTRSMRLNSLPVSSLNFNRSPGCSGYICVGYRGSFAFGRDGLVDVKFRKISRIIVCGKVSLLRDVFNETLNESRDPDRGSEDRYTARFFLKHNYIEQAFDMLQESGFSLVGSCASGTSNSNEALKPGMDPEESRWQHYNEFIFCR